jgi:hypothetical protein
MRIFNLLSTRTVKGQRNLKIQKKRKKRHHFGAGARIVQICQFLRDSLISKFKKCKIRVNFTTKNLN